MNKRLTKKNRSGFTMLEMIVSLGISSVVIVITAYVMVASAKNMKTIRNQTEASKDAYAAIDQIRYSLMSGKFGTVQVKDSGKWLEFKDPNLGNKVSAFKFENGALWYDMDINDATPFEKKMDRLADLKFTSTIFGAIITIEATARPAKGEILGKNVRASTDILLRN